MNIQFDQRFHGYLTVQDNDGNALEILTPTQVVLVMDEEDHKWRCAPRIEKHESLWQY